MENQVEFELATANLLQISDHELAVLLNEIYVQDGWTPSDRAVSLFDPAAVRKRGLLIGARESLHSRLAGIIILVPPDSPARHLAKAGEAELHLLGVKREFRNLGLGRSLVEAALGQARQAGYSKIILWTLNGMNAARKLYESVGFNYIGNAKVNDRDFKVYEKPL